jgi:two-component system sensor histidine kinase PhoQ
MSLKLSIRDRLLVSAATILCLFALLLGYALLVAYRTTLEEMVRNRLAADARTVMAVARERNGQLVLPRMLENPRFNQVGSDLVALIFDSNGELIWRSPSADDFHPSYRPVYREGQAEFLRISAGAGDYFIYDLDLQVGESGYSIVTGDTAVDVDRSVVAYRNNLLLWLGGSIAALVLLLGAALAWSLRPLRALRRQLGEVQRGDVTSLEGAFPSEVAGLVRALNRLLAVEHARQTRYRTALAELAHGLKTPLAVMSEVIQTLPPGEPREVLQSQLQRVGQQVSYQVQRIVPGSGGLVPRPLLLQPVLEKLCTALVKIYPEKGVRWQLALGDTALLLSEAQALELFGNLLENAFRLCLQEVRVAAQRDGDGVVISVDDDGAGVLPALRERILERGGRADPHHEGQGIGLAVVVDLVSELGGRVVIDDSDLGGASFRLLLPATALG